MELHRFLALLLLVPILPAAAQDRAEVYVSEKGFSIQVPPGWLRIDKETVQGMLRQDRDLARITRGMNFDRIALCAVRPAAGDFAWNFNVLVAPDRIPVTEVGKEKLARMLKAQFAARRVNLEGFQASFAEFNGVKGIRLDYSWSHPRSDLVVRQIQAAVPVGGRTVILTCSADEYGFAAAEPVFQEVLESLEVNSGLADLWFGLPRAVRYGLIGGLVGLVMALGKKLLGGPARPISPLAAESYDSPFAEAYCPAGALSDRDARPEVIRSQGCQGAGGAPGGLYAGARAGGSRADGEERPSLSSYEPPPWEQE